jgi:hypothetical protein
MYHSYSQTHAGYLLSIIVGLAALISSWNIFFLYNPNVPLEFTFLCILGMLFSGAIYTITRISYWTMLANTVLTVNLEKTHAFVNSHHKQGEEPLTCIAALHGVTFEYCKHLPKQAPRHHRIAVCFSENAVPMFVICSCSAFLLLLVLNYFF